MKLTIEPALAIAACLASASALAERCSELAGRAFGDGKVATAEFVASGDTIFKNPFAGEVKTPGELCRVRAQVSAVAGSNVTVEVWLPTKWNGKMLGWGGGGLNGGLGAGSEIGIAKETTRGYAGVINNAGHDVSESTAWAIGNPEKIVDYGHRANHVAAVFGKSVIAAYYDKPLERSYFHGCSNGGRDALMLAQRYPEDYDGIVAGAPAFNFTGLMTTFMRNGKLMDEAFKTSAVAQKLKLVREAALKKCDALDGVADGVLENPASCRFDPSELQCSSDADPASCLSTQQAMAIQQIYAGLRTPNGTNVLSGFPVSSEFGGSMLEGWGHWFGGLGSGGVNMGTEFFRGLVYNSTDWSADSFELDRDYLLANKRVGPAIDATNADLSAFTRRGGKLLLYHGWEDPAIPATGTLDYYDAVLRKTGASASRQVRLLMMPGTAHCALGPGPNDFDKVLAMENWVERDIVPDRIVATKFDDDLAVYLGKPAKPVRTRPLCAWPKTAHYKGTGSTDDAENYVCQDSN
jgi:pimeloyl-ACP methyl ester carboxylesterase